MQNNHKGKVKHYYLEQKQLIFIHLISSIKKPFSFYKRFREKEKLRMKRRKNAGLSPSEEARFQKLAGIRYEYN